MDVVVSQEKMTKKITSTCERFDFSASCPPTQPARQTLSQNNNSSVHDCSQSQPCLNNSTNKNKQEFPPRQALNDQYPANELATFSHNSYEDRILNNSSSSNDEDCSKKPNHASRRANNNSIHSSNKRANYNKRKHDNEDLSFRKRGATKKL